MKRRKKEEKHKARNEKRVVLLQHPFRITREGLLGSDGLSFDSSYHWSDLTACMNRNASKMFSPSGRAKSGWLETGRKVTRTVNQRLRLIGPARTT
jgi:hypothetical protein